MVSLGQNDQYFSEFCRTRVNYTYFAETSLLFLYLDYKTGGWKQIFFQSADYFFIVFLTSDLTDISYNELLRAFGVTVRDEKELTTMKLSALITKVDPKSNDLSVSGESANHGNSDK